MTYQKIIFQPLTFLKRFDTVPLQAAINCTNNGSVEIKKASGMSYVLVGCYAVYEKNSLFSLAQGSLIELHYSTTLWLKTAMT